MSAEEALANRFPLAADAAWPARRTLAGTGDGALAMAGGISRASSKAEIKSVPALLTSAKAEVVTVPTATNAWRMNKRMNIVTICIAIFGGKSANKVPKTQRNHRRADSLKHDGRKECPAGGVG